MDSGKALAHLSMWLGFGARYGSGPQLPQKLAGQAVRSQEHHGLEPLFPHCELLRKKICTKSPHRTNQLYFRGFSAYTSLAPGERGATSCRTVRCQEELNGKKRRADGHQEICQPAAL